MQTVILGRRSMIVVGLLLAGWTASIHADEKLAGRACRSVHLGYPAGAGTAFYNEVTVDRSAPGTYFCAIGWNKGYFGIQELDRGKKVVIFSVWDSNQDEKSAVDESKRVKLLHKDEKVRIGRFGGEGTGGQSFLDFDWKVGATYRFLVTSRVDGERTEYAGYFRGPDDPAWTHLVTFSTITGGKDLGGYYSFVEDFKRNKVSATIAREAHYGNAWVKLKDGGWKPVERARFTADKNPSLAINAKVDAGRFVLVTGGSTENTDTKLNDSMDLPPAERKAPEGLPEAPPT
ncbi:DUF3472 domain-containing protein [Tundrisphaera sp. TA3]|uniref:DUF3472 domain-containing protein n=1 Tax=Tundrisphaera sp. TA3 TaxID=3435775 RepID=UPI003EB7AC2F